MPLEGGNTAQTDLHGLATFSLIWWTINPCAVLQWILSVPCLSCIFWKSWSNPPLGALFSYDSGSVVKGNTCKLKMQGGRAFQGCAISVRFEGWFCCSSLEFFCFSVAGLNLVWKINSCILLRIIYIAPLITSSVLFTSLKSQGWHRGQEKHVYYGLGCRLA